MDLWHREDDIWKRRGYANYGISSGQDTPWLPFSLATRETLAASDKKVFGHKFLTFPIRPTTAGTSAADDYWATKWMPTGGTEGLDDHSDYGGLVRDRKEYVADIASGYEIRNYLTEIGWGIDAGLDGYLVNVVKDTPTGDTTMYDRVQDLYTAAANLNDPYFKIIPMFDGNTGGTDNATQTADFVYALRNNPAMYYDGEGDMWFASFKPEHAPDGAGSGGSTAVAWWNGVMNDLAGRGLETAFLPCFEETWTAAAQAPAFSVMSRIKMMSRWGSSDAEGCGAETTGARLAPYTARTTYNREWMHYVRPQDCRPNQSAWWEAGGLDILYNCWMAAIDGDAEWMQLVTLDDFAEGTQFAPTEGSGYAWLDLNAYFLQRFKLGAWPTIERDALYLIHRKQFITGASYSFTASDLMPATPSASGSTAARDEIDCVIFAAENNTTVAVKVNGVTAEQQTFSRGFHQLKVDLALGTISATATRGATTVADVTSPHVVSNSQLVQNYLYYASSSLRQELEG